MMKFVCSGCMDDMLYQTLERFETRGNWCEKCLSKANKKMGLERKRIKWWNAFYDEHPQEVI